MMPDDVAPSKAGLDGSVATQRMAPPPRLPSALDDLTVRGDDLVQDAANTFERACDFTQQVARAHQEYLDRSTELHRRFLDVWQRTNVEWAEALRDPPPGIDTVPVTGSEAVAELDLHPREPASPAKVPGGPVLDYDDLVTLASGRVASVFGDRFMRQDGHAHQVRPPKPPLLFVDRVTRIDAEPGAMGHGGLWTETDVHFTSWYLDDAGRMPPGVVAEAGDGHLVLLSWLGVDWQHDGRRRGRLIGAEVTIRNALPQAGDTCVYEVQLEGHAKVGDAPIAILRYVCSVDGEPRAAMRVHMGLFSTEELAAPGTLTWNPAADHRALEEPFELPEGYDNPRSFTRDAVRAFAEGRPADCFGPGFERASAHVRTPKIPDSRLRIIEEIEAFEPRGGPWSRGYLRSAATLRPDAWFFNAHFHNDPCMPGSLMLEAGLQSMAVHMAALGLTLERDGWRFEAVPATYSLVFKGQITPAHTRLACELFVEALTAGAEPTLVADIRISIDGRAVFYVRRARLRLVPDTPLEYWAGLGPPVTLETGARVPISRLAGLVGHVDNGEVATIDGLRLDWASLLNGAVGRPSKAMGTILERFDGGRPMPRMPGPPFLFVSRTTRLDAAAGRLVPGASAEFAYDVPARVWYFEQQGAPVMPFAVLLEVMLQACGWLSFYGAAPLPLVDTAFMFRNLDGTGTVRAEVCADIGTLRTRVRVVSVSPLANTSLLTFEVETQAGSRSIATVLTTFGFFPPDAFRDQVGLPASQEERARVSAERRFLVDLKQRPARYCEGSPRLAGPMLLMLDRITAFDSTGGPAGLGYVRGEKDVDPSEWFFKAHFFRDPVQPGSLGLESLCQLLQFYLIERDLAAGIANPRFESIQLERPITWKYRGQIIPENRRIVTEIVVKEVGQTVRGPFAVADGWLWIDDVRVYSVSNLAVGIAGGG